MQNYPFIDLYSSYEVMIMEEVLVSSGLEGVVVTLTGISDVNGTRGELTYRGRPIQEVVATYHWEQVLRFLSGVAPRNEPPITYTVSPDSTDDPMTRFARLALEGDYDDSRPFDYVRRLPLALAATRKASNDPGCGLIAYRYLTMLRGQAPTDREANALDAYWVTIAEHSLNASTFAVRIAASTGALLPMAIAVGIGVLSGPLHGGAPTGVLKLLDEARRVDDIDELLKTKLDSGQRLMGFGHRVYRTMDPRAIALRQAFEDLAHDHDVVRLALAVEKSARKLLGRRYPNRVLATNVEFYAAALLDTLGIDAAWCPPTFAAGRLAGWTAHYMEQLATGRLIRPLARYEDPGSSPGSL